MGLLDEALAEIGDEPGGSLLEAALAEIEEPKPAGPVFVQTDVSKITPTPPPARRPVTPRVLDPQMARVDRAMQTLAEQDPNLPMARRRITEPVAVPPSRGAVLGAVDAFTGTGGVPAPRERLRPPGPAKTEYPLAREAENALMRGGLRAAESIGTAMRAIGATPKIAATVDEAGNPIPTTPDDWMMFPGLHEKGKVIEAFWRKEALPFAMGEDIQGLAWDRPSLFVNPKWLVATIAEQVPLMAAAIIPGVGAGRLIAVGGKAFNLTPQVIEKLARLGAASTGGVSGGMMEGAGAHQAVIQQGGTEAEAAGAWAAMSMAVAGLEAVGLDGMLRAGRRLGAAEMAKVSRVREVLKSTGKETATEYLEEPIESVITGEPITEGLKQGLNVLPAAAASGGGVAAVSAAQGARQDRRAEPPVPERPPRVAELAPPVAAPVQNPTLDQARAGLAAAQDALAQERQRGTDLAARTPAAPAETPAARPAPVVFAGWQNLRGTAIPLYHLTANIPGHPEGSTLFGTTLTGEGYTVPDPPEPPPAVRPRKAPPAPPVAQAPAVTPEPPAVTAPVAPTVPERPASVAVPDSVLDAALDEVPEPTTEVAPEVTTGVELDDGALMALGEMVNELELAAPGRRIRTRRTDARRGRVEEWIAQPSTYPAWMAPQWDPKGRTRQNADRMIDEIRRVLADEPAQDLAMRAYLLGVAQQRAVDPETVARVRQLAEGPVAEPTEALSRPVIEALEIGQAAAEGTPERAAYLELQDWAKEQIETLGPEEALAAVEADAEDSVSESAGRFGPPLRLTKAERLDVLRHHPDLGEEAPSGTARVAPGEAIAPAPATAGVPPALAGRGERTPGAPDEGRAAPVDERPQADDVAPDRLDDEPTPYRSDLATPEGQQQFARDILATMADALGQAAGRPTTKSPQKEGVYGDRFSDFIADARRLEPLGEERADPDLDGSDGGALPPARRRIGQGRTPAGPRRGARRPEDLGGGRADLAGAERQEQGPGLPLAGPDVGGRPPAVVRTEPTPEGDQVLIPDTPARTVPLTRLRSEAPQRPVDETPLFGQDREARDRESDAAQGGLFDTPLPRTSLEPHDYSSTQIELPQPVSDEILAWARENIPETDRAPDGLEQHHHVTVRYGLETTDADAVTRALGQAGPIKFRLGPMALFRQPEQDVLYVAVESDDLRALHEKLAAVEHTDTQPEYVPHVTIAYLKKGRGDQWDGNTRFAGRAITLGRVSFMPKDGSEPTTIPLGAESPAIVAEPPGTVREDEADYAPRTIEPAPAFYSALRETIKTRMQSAAVAPLVRNLVRAGGVKADEIAWSGLDEWLEAQGGRKVTKDEVLAFLDANAVRVEEIVLGESDAAAGAARLAADRLEMSLSAAGLALSASLRDDGIGQLDRANILLARDTAASRRLATGEIGSDRSRDLAERRWEAQEAFEAARRDIARLSPRASKFKGYTLPGAEPGSYRELLLTLPRTDTHAEREEIGRKLEAVRLRTPPDRDYMEDPEYVALRADMRALGDDDTQPFRSPHWDEPNVLAHIRFDERRTADGQRTMHVSEIQSDWHQQGRREGYRGDVAVRPFVTERGEQNGFEGFDRTTGARLTGVYGTEEQARSAALNAQGELTRAVPAAPLAKTWYETAFRRAVRWSAERGLGAVTWDTGAINADRYDLSKHIDQLRYEINDRGNWDIYGDRDGQLVVSQEDTDATRLPDIVGKDIADKILSGTHDDYPGRQAGKLTGLDLKVGGEGMRGFYDKILVDYANKFGKRWGARVESAEVPTLNAGALIPDGAGGVVRAPRFEVRARDERTWGVVDTVENKYVGGVFSDRDRAAAFAADQNRAIGRAMERVWRLPITPSMRKSVLTEGVALFEGRRRYTRRRDADPEAQRKAEQLSLDAIGDLARTIDQVAPPTVGGPVPAVGVPPRGGLAPVGLRERALGFVRDLADTGHLTLVGQSVPVDEPAMLAVLLQPVRNPKFETLRIFTVQGDQIVGEEITTSRLPDSAPAPWGVFGTREQAQMWAREFVASAKARGADGFWLSHNHPSGDPKASKADTAVTRYMRELVVEAAQAEGLSLDFRGHVIIDSDTYGVIAPDGTARVADLPGAFLPDPILRPTIPHPLLGAPVNSAADLAAIGAALEVPSDYVSLVFTGTGTGQVRALADLPLTAFANPAAAADLIRRATLGYGSSRAFAYYEGGRADLAWATGQTLVRDGILTDFVLRTDRVLSAADTVPRRPESQTHSEFLGQRLDIFRQERVVRDGEVPYVGAGSPATRGRTEPAIVAEPTVPYESEGRATLRMAQQLRERGYTGEEIARMTPAEARAFLAAPVPTRPIEGRAPTVPRLESVEPPAGGAVPPETPTKAGIPEIPPLTEPVLQLRHHREVLAAAEEVMTREGIARDKARYPILSDQILDLIKDDRLPIDGLREAARLRGLDIVEFGEFLFRPAIRNAAQRLAYLSVLERRLRQMASDGEATAGQARTLLDWADHLGRLRQEETDDPMLRAQSLWRRGYNVWRGMLTTQLATAVRNVLSQEGRLAVDVLDRTIQKAMSGRGSGADPIVALDALADSLAQLRPTQAGARARAEAQARIDRFLDAYPKQWDRLFGTYLSDLARQARETGGAPPNTAERAMRGAESVVNLANWANQFQEYAVRRGVFWAELDGQLRERHLDAERIARGTAGLTRAQLEHVDIATRAAVGKALELTFAETPRVGSFSDPNLGWIVLKAMNKTFGVGGVVPFPRFMLNALKFYFEFSPLGLMKLASPVERARVRSGDRQVLSRAVIGSVLWLASWLLREAQDDGLRWYEVDAPGGVVDVRPFNPFASYLFLGEVAKRLRTGTLYKIDGGDVLRAVASVNVRGGLGVYALDKAMQGLGSFSEPGDWTRAVKTGAGQAVAGLLTPLRTITDLYAQFDPEMRIVRESRSEPFLGPTKAFFGVGEPVYLPTRSEPLTREAPALRQATGITLGGPKNALERELRRLHFNRHEVLPPTGIPEADNLLAKYMGSYADALSDLLAAEDYRSLGTGPEKALTLRKYLASARKLATREFREARPDLADQVKLRRLPNWERLLLEDLDMAPAGR